MKKLMVLFAVIFIAGCRGSVGVGVTFSNPHNPASLSEITTKRCELKPFKSIVVSDDAKIELANGPYAVEITGRYLNKYHCYNSVVGQTLYIDGVGDKKSNFKVKLYVPKLKMIVVAGRAIVNAKNFKSDDLTVIAKDRGSINIEGEFNVNKIVQHGRGRINVHWVHSDILYVEGYNNGPIYLSGRANDIMVKLMGNARLYARYLRARNVAVLTTDSAIAEVSALDMLSAYAVDDSNIFYYKKPKDITVVTRDSGNVLYPEWIQ